MGRATKQCRYLRRKQTEAEALLWKFLRSRQLVKLKFRRQHPVAGFILDFYCSQYKLCVELGGGPHNSRAGSFRDSIRDRLLALEGITVLRFENIEVIQDLDGVLRKIELSLKNIYPLPLGRGIKGEG